MRRVRLIEVVATRRADRTPDQLIEPLAEILATALVADFRASLQHKDHGKGLPPLWNKSKPDAITRSVHRLMTGERIDAAISVRIRKQDEQEKSCSVVASLPSLRESPGTKPHKAK